MTPQSAIAPAAPAEAIPRRPPSLRHLRRREVVAAAPDARWDALMMAVAVYIATTVGRIHQVFPILEVARPALVSALLAAVLLALDRRRSRRVWPVLRQPMIRWLLAFLVWVGFSVPGALWPGLAASVFVNVVAKAVLMTIVIVAAVRGPRDVFRLALVYFGTTAIYAAIVLTRFHVDPPTARLTAALYYYDPNDFGLLIVSGLPFGALGVLRARTLLMRGLCAAGLIVAGVVFVWSGSRGAFLALVVVVLFSLVRLTVVPVRWRLFGLAAVGLTLMLTGSDRYWKQMGTIVDNQNDYNRTAPEGRLQVWRRGLGYMIERPILGVGVGNYRIAEGTISPLAKQQERGIGLKWSAAHNSYVEVAAETGFPGFTFFAASIGCALAALRRVIVRFRPEPGVVSDQRLLAQTCMAGLLGFVCGAVFLSLAYADMLYVLLALALGIRKISAPGPV